MAKKDRSKEIWHIPKRGSVHQTTYMVFVLSGDKFLRKSWSSGKQEALGSEMGKAGLTESGRAITHQSVRTLLANVPKYLGFVYLDESSKPPRIIVTDIGYELIKKHNVNKIPAHKNLSDYYKHGHLIETSEIFAKQMSKLIITNPSIRNDCQNILVFPFRMTLKILLELEYLDIEELGYILFHTKAEDQLLVVIEKIKNFRSLPPEKRTAEIEAYRKTEEGKLTLVKAPTAGYYMYLCYSTGLCKRVKKKVNKKTHSTLPAIQLKDKQEVKELLTKYEGVEIYDFRDYWFLWKEYFTKPNRLHPPFDIKINKEGEEEVMVDVVKDEYTVGSDTISQNKELIVPVFPGEDYQIMAYNLKNGEKIYSKVLQFRKDNRKVVLDLKKHLYKKEISKDVFTDQIKEMFSDKYNGFDEEYSKKLEVIGKFTKKNYIDNYRRGGRLEFLFYSLLNQLKNEHIIDEVYWYGDLDRYDIAKPAPGGREGNPDVVFEIDDYLFVLELTTIIGNRSQWQSSEASSVPDHIKKMKETHKDKKVIGIFCAPSIHHQLEKNLTLNAKQDNVGMVFKPCISFADFLTKCDREQLKNNLVNEAKKQIHS